MWEEDAMNRVLVVDEDMAIRLLYADELGEEGYEVITGEVGSRLMEVIAEKRPDVVVVDVPPDDPDGMGLCQDIRKTYDDVSVILSTVYETRCPEVDGTADRCGTVSSSLEELKCAIERAVEERRRSLWGALFCDTKAHGESLEKAM
jgi:DNA-binding NtrC family response regulator